MKKEILNPHNIPLETVVESKKENKLFVIQGHYGWRKINTGEGDDYAMVPLYIVCPVKPGTFLPDKRRLRNKHNPVYLEYDLKIR